MEKSKNLQQKIISQNRARIMQVDGLSRKRAVRVVITKKVVKRAGTKPRAFFVVPRQSPSTGFTRLDFVKKLYVEKRVPVLAAVLALIIAFGGGVWATLSTGKSQADSQPQVLGASTDQPSSPPQGQPIATGPLVTGQQLQSQGGADISNNALFNTPIQYLQDYFASINQPDIISKRQAQLAQFLTAMHSPLAGSADMIAQQSHWQLILAIAFAESSLGKNCTDFNCSNIGIKPGSPIWHKYASYNDWVVDFNRLLDKKYNDWTLQQMCGVYVKPCNPNWLLATQEILGQLNQQGIE